MLEFVVGFGIGTVLYLSYRLVRYCTYRRD